LTCILATISSISDVRKTKEGNEKGRREIKVKVYLFKMHVFNPFYTHE